MELVIISGRSGSGKSTALQALEDSGFYCVDNLPVGLLPTLVFQVQQDEEASIQTIAVGIDARNLPCDLGNFPIVLKQVNDLKVNTRIIYLDAQDDTLLKRFSATRRKHPLSNEERSLAEALSYERELLAAIADKASWIMDTSHLSVHQLRTLVKERIHTSTDNGMSIMFSSFGFKHGTPADADFIFDVRHLPNPYWEARLREKTGLDEEVQAFLKNQPAVCDMIQDIAGFLERWLPSFRENNRSYLTIAIGCTGGQHRSVFIADALFRHFQASGHSVLLRHREL